MMSASISNNIAISIRNATVLYKQKKSFFRSEYFESLKKVSLDLFKGESLGIIGCNGAGKSTLLRLLCGIISPNSGDITNFGFTTALLALQVGFDPLLSGRNNAILSGMLLGFKKREIEDCLEKIISFAELDTFIDQPVKTYSTGMRARLGFSVAIHLDPDILLVDEILAVGDSQFQKKSMAIMQERLLSDRTIVFVSHQIPLMRSLCDRVIWLENGIVKRFGDTQSITQEYEIYHEQSRQQ
jgi:lipopolysaccharide transport system ATP-binding protein